MTQSGGRDIYSFDVSSGSYHYEVADGGYLRAMQAVYIKTEFETFDITANVNTLDNHHAESSGQMDANGLYMNAGHSRFVELANGGDKDVYPIRVEQVQDGLTANYFTEPDYHFTLIDCGTGERQTFSSLTGGSAASGSVSVSPSPSLNKRGREEYRLTGLSPGLSVLLVSYDAMELRNSIGQGNKNNVIISDVGDPLTKYFNPINPADTATVVIAVGGDSSGIDTGIDLDVERDAVYFDNRESGVDFTFKPSSNEEGEVSVRVHPPLYSHEWGEWKNGSKGEDGAYTVSLKEGQNIIEVKSPGGKAKYHVVMARPVEMKYSVNGAEFDPAATRVAEGDKVKVELLGLVTPVQKLAGIYNPGVPEGGDFSKPPSVYAVYDQDGARVESSHTQYLLNKGATLEFTAKTGETRLTGGSIHCGYFGKRWGFHRQIPPEGTPGMVGGAVDVEETDGRGSYRGILPDIAVSTTAPEENKPGEPTLPEPGEPDPGSGSPAKPDITPPPFTAIDPEIRPGGDAHTATDDEIAAVIDALPPEAADALDMATETNESGELVSNPGAIADALPVGERAEIAADSDDMIPLPVFKTDVDSGKTALVTIAMPLGKYAGLALSDVAVLKFKSDGVTERLASASSPAGISHAEYVWTDGDGAALPSGGKIASDRLYYLSVAIKDNSAYDWDRAPGSVMDPMALALVKTAGKPAEKPADDNKNPAAGDSGGCDAGMGLLGFAAFAGLVIAARRRAR